MMERRDASLALAGLCLLLPSTLLHAALPHAASSSCPCASSSDALSSLHQDLDATTTRRYELSCCPRLLLAAHDYHNHTFNITWSFKGEEIKITDGMELQEWPREVSTFRVAFCHLETLESDGVRVGDEGDYSCRVTSSSGASVTRTFTLCLNRNEDIDGPPVKSRISEDTHALPGEEVTFNCLAYVGRLRCGSSEGPRLTWTKELSNRSWVPAASLRHTHILTPGEENGVMSSRLRVRPVEPAHYGRYRCTVTNHHGRLQLNVTLRKGVVAVVRVSREYRAALVVMVATVVVLVVFSLVWHRCKVVLALYFREKHLTSATAGSPILVSLGVTEASPDGSQRKDVMSQPLLL